MVSAAWSDGMARGGCHRLCGRRTQQPERSVALSPGYDAGDLFFATAVGRPLNPNNVLRLRRSGAPGERAEGALP